MRRRRTTMVPAMATLLFGTAAAGAPGAIEAQIDEVVRGVEGGVVRFHYDARAGVEICDQGIRMGDDRMQWRWNGRETSARGCREGVVEIELEIRDGRVRDVEVVTDRDGRARRAVDVGEVTPGQAAGYLLSLAYRGATSDGAEDAIFPAIIADVEGVWLELLVIARDRSVHAGVRKNALFWLGQEAADAVTEGLATVATDQGEDQDVRNSAIFALSQRDDEEAVTALMDVARSGVEAESRRTAMFWLAQSDDPRVVQFFEDILTGRNH